MVLQTGGRKVSAIEQYADYVLRVRAESERLWNRLYTEMMLIGLCGWPPWMARIEAEVQ